MKLGHDIYLEQQQKLLMTPELRQAIAMLQMSTLELGEYIQNELQENPFLEEKEANESDETDNETDASNEAETEDKSEELLEYYNDRDIGLTVTDAEDKSFDSFISKSPSLYEHLQFQLRMTICNQEDLLIGEYMIGSIDANGYLTVTMEEMVSATGADLERVQHMLTIIQSFQPRGIGARDLKECLLIQLEHYGRDDIITTTIVEEYLGDLGKGRINKIAQQLGANIQQVQEACDFIRSLDPKPGLQYSSGDEIKYIIADIVVEKIDDEYVVIVNDSGYPHLMINRLYEKMIRRPESFSPEALKYMEEKMGSAVWLIKSIEQRRMTLYKVARCIVDIQREFLDKGIMYIKPLNLKQVAELVDVHESTVSRATSNKYIQTPQGLFELKFFFGSGVSSYVDNDKVSSKSIKKLIQDLIEQEDPCAPLSDQQLADIIKNQGTIISRRTVAKYRQEMGIQSTVARKRY